MRCRTLDRGRRSGKPEGTLIGWALGLAPESMEIDARVGDSVAPDSPRPNCQKPRWLQLSTPQREGA